MVGYTNLFFFSLSLSHLLGQQLHHLVSHCQFVPEHRTPCRLVLQPLQLLPRVRPNPLELVERKLQSFAALGRPCVGRWQPFVMQSSDVKVGPQVSWGGGEGRGGVVLRLIRGRSLIAPTYTPISSSSTSIGTTSGGGGTTLPESS